MKEIIVAPRPVLWKDWTDARARRATRERLQKIVNLYAEIGAIWGDVDQSIVDEADRAIVDVCQRDRDWREAWAENDSMQANGGDA